LTRNSRAICDHNDERSLYSQIRSKNWVSIPTKCLTRRDETTTETDCYDSNGATLVHQCFHYQRYDMVKWLVRSFPQFSLKPHKMYDEDGEQLPYGGENVLHMAVETKNLEMARWLLDFYSKFSDECLFELLTARVVTRGKSYYRKTGKHYYGETALHFAICMDDKAMVDLIMSFVSLLHTELRATDSDYENEKHIIRAGRSLLFMPDCNGNNAIHLCVLHNLPAMYDHVKYIALEMIRQELMREYHHSVSLLVGPMLEKKKAHEPTAVKYVDFYGTYSERAVVDHTDYSFTGYIWNLTAVDLPKEQIRQRFFDVQAAKFALEFVRLTGQDPAASSPEEQCRYRDVLTRLCSNAKTSDWLASLLVKQDDRMSDTGVAVGDVLDAIVDANENSKRRYTFVDQTSGSLHEEDFELAANLSNMFGNVNDYDWDEWFERKEDELKLVMRQWLYGTDIGLRDGAVYRLFKELFLLGLNEIGHSPVTLAAANGKTEILRHLIKENVVSRDRNYDCDLTGIEFPLIQDNPDRARYSPQVPGVIRLHGAIWWICKNKDNNHLIEEIPEVKAVIVAKWERVGYMIANRNSLLHLFFLIPLMVLTCLVYDNNHDYVQHPHELQGPTWLLVWCGSLLLAILGHNMRYLRRGPFTQRLVGAAKFDFGMRVLIATIFTCAGLVRLFWHPYLQYHHSHDYYSTLFCTLVGACCLCSMIYSFLFLTLCADVFGSFMITVTRIFMKDFANFASFWLRIVVMFGLALKTITEDIDNNGFKHAFRCMWALVRLSFPNGVPTNEFNPLARQHQEESVWFSFLATFFCLLVNILIINLLIAVISNTYIEFNRENALGMFE
jgi:hypothetical protein